MLATFLRDITATFLSVTDMYICTYAHHENRFWIRKLAALAIKLLHIIIRIVFSYLLSEFEHWRPLSSTQGTP